MLFRPLALMAILSILICLQRILTYNEPTDRDIATYGVIAHEVISGKSIYKGSLMDQKPPGIHFTYGVAELIVGYGRQQIFLLGVVAAIATLLGTFWIGTSISNSSGIWASVFWTVICSSLPLEANQPNSEVFINAWIILGLAFLVHQSRSEYKTYFPSIAAGLCFATATLYKHSVVTIPIFAATSYFIFPISPRNRIKSFYDFSIIGLIGLLSWLVLFIYFAATGRLSNLVDCLFKYNSFYSGSVLENIFSFCRFFPSILIGFTPLIILILIGASLAIYYRNINEVIFVISLALGAMIAVAIPGRFYPHYYQLWFPFLLVGSAYSVKWINCYLGKHKFIPTIIFSIILFFLIAYHIPTFFLSDREWSQRKYGNIFLITDNLSHELKAILLPNECFYQIGSQAQLYFDTHKRPVGPLSDDQVFSGPVSEKLFSEMMDRLHDTKPDIVVLEKYSITKIPQDSPFINWLSSNYILAPESFNHDPFFLFVRRNSNLQRRLESKY